MTKGKLTREQAIQKVGAKAVESVEAENCDYTGRLQTDGDTSVEFSASVHCTDTEGMPCSLIAYYYQAEDDLEDVDDFSLLDWEIEGYEII